MFPSLGGSSQTQAFQVREEPTPHQEESNSLQEPKSPQRERKSPLEERKSPMSAASSSKSNQGRRMEREVPASLRQGYH